MHFILFLYVQFALTFLLLSNVIVTNTSSYLTSELIVLFYSASKLNSGSMQCPCGLYSFTKTEYYMCVSSVSGVVSV